MSDQPLHGRVALVTGAARRLGRHVALELARAGADLLLHYHSGAGPAAEVAALAAVLGRRAFALSADLREPTEVTDLFVRARRLFPRLDLLVNNAADFERLPLAELTVERWDSMHALNLRAPYLCSREAVPWMRESGGGVIINIADVAGLIPWSHHLHYAVAKAGLVAMTRCLALELAPAIRVHAVAPGTVIPAEGQTAEELAAVRRRTPLGSTAGPEEVAAAVRFLAVTPGITGQVIAVDGGRSLSFGE